MNRKTAIEMVTAALRADGGKMQTDAICKAVPQLHRGAVLAALAHLKRKKLADSDYAPTRQPEQGWTYWLTDMVKQKRPRRTKGAITDGFTRVLVEWLDAAGCSCTMHGWKDWTSQIEDRLRLHSAFHSLKKRNFVVVVGNRIVLTDEGRAALQAGRAAVPEAPPVEKFDADPLMRQPSTDPMVSAAKAEKRWLALMRGRRFQDIPAHLIRPLQVLRWTPPIETRSMTGSSGAMLAENRSAHGGST